MFGVSSLGTVSVEELRKSYDTPQVYQFYFHKDRGLNRAMMERANVLLLPHGPAAPESTCLGGKGR